jgi:hypothetical protein
MNKRARSAQQAEVDFGPAFKMYLDNMESWKKSYEKMLTNATGATLKGGFDPINPSYAPAMTGWQNLGGDGFKHVIEQQLELCRFFGRRWQLYLDMSTKVARCKTPAEFGQLQLDFINRMSTEYIQESAKLAQPVTEMMVSWLSGRPVH